MLGVCYYPEHWPEEWWADDARRMKAMGISFVRIAEFAWSRIEPSRDAFHFEWLDRAIDVLGKAGLKVVMCTPTATPPKWLMDEHPDIAPVDEQGRLRGFGSRRHYSFSSPIWIKETKRICEIIAARYGKNQHVAGWQTDNEYGCHSTILSWGQHDLKAFQGWLRQRYQTPDQLNEAWGNVFWSMELRSFEEISLPNLTVTETNPAARLDFWRFSSDQVAAYNSLQCAIIRKHSPGRWITHNYMGLFHEFDHFKVSEDLDLASWDSYPVGFTEMFKFSAEEKLKWQDTAHPDMAPFHHDLYRGMKENGRWWVMEQQPGPVNWAPWNPIPKPGMIRLYTWEALAHGAECVSYFRWRQAPFAQEQMHAGLNLPNNQGLSVGGKEATKVGAELTALGALPASTKADVALVFDYEASWVFSIQPQGQDFSYEELSYRWYETVRRLGLDVDILPPGRDLSGYKLVLVPSLPVIDEAAMAAFTTTTATLLFGARSGSKTRSYSIPDNLPPGPLQDLLPMKVKQVASFRPNVRIPVQGTAIKGHGTRWRDEVTAEAGSTVLATFDTGDAAVLHSGRTYYLATWPDQQLIDSALRKIVKAAGIATLPLPENIRLRRRGGLTFAFNYGPENWTVPEAKKKIFVLGGAEVKPQDLAVWKSSPA
jgi:beta-galactosidase